MHARALATDGGAEGLVHGDGRERGLYDEQGIQRRFVAAMISDRGAHGEREAHRWRDTVRDDVPGGARCGAVTTLERAPEAVIEPADLAGLRAVAEGA